MVTLLIDMAKIQGNYSRILARIQMYLRKQLKSFLYDKLVTCYGAKTLSGMYFFSVKFVVFVEFYFVLFENSV